MDDYTTRIATPQDAKAVEGLLEASYPTLMAEAYDEVILAPVLKLITKANEKLLASGGYYVAEAKNGSVIGCGGWSIEKPLGAEDVAGAAGHLRHFGTHPAWIRRGVGRAIYRECEAAALKENVCTMEVLSSLNGEQFYTALGFQKVRIISVKIGPNSFPSVLMRRTI